MKKYLLILFAAGLCLQACKENSMDVPEPKGQADSFANENGSWTRLGDFIDEGSPFEFFASDGYGFAIGEKGYFSGGRGGTVNFREYDITTKQFSLKSSVPSFEEPSDFVAFSIGSMGYVGAATAQAGGGELYGLTDFFQYNPQTDTWSRKAVLPESITEAVGFAINGKGYLGVGKVDTVKFNDETNQTETHYSPSRSFYEYSPESNCWVRKADFPGDRRVRAVAFSIGNKAYVGTGTKFDRTGAALNDFWEYDPSTDKWTRKADFPGGARYDAVGFSIGNKGYIGTGASGGISGYKDFWEYDPMADRWKRKDDFPGGGRSQMAYFSTGTKGYVIGGEGLSGDNDDFWEFDPAK